MDVLLLAGLIFINGLFAMSEIALVAAKTSRLKRMAETRKAASVALSLKENPNTFLSTIQIGITVIGLLSGIVGEATLSKPFAEFLVSAGMHIETVDYLSTACVVLGITYFAIVVGELVPKRIAQSHAEAIAVLVARPIRWISIVTRPFVVALSVSTQTLLKGLGVREDSEETVTEDDIQAILNEGSESGAIEPREQIMIRNILHLNDRLVSSLMTPRRDIDYLDINQPVDQVLVRIRSTKHSVFPICRGNLDNVIGTVSSKLLLNHVGDINTTVIAKLLKHPMYVPESMKGLTLLDHMQRQGTEMAFIVDEYGDIQGLVTHYDLLEAIAGELSLSPQDLWAQDLEEGGWVMDALIPLNELKDRLGVSTLEGEETEGFQTLNGMLSWLAEKVPGEGEVLVHQGWRFEVLKVKHNRIAKVKVTQERAETEAEI
ncbi:Magnesium and cobalt efflux protein CorC [Grimontia celer]|uniref:Magnesium and cobalt efflux protein CorC n=1 Tax=Grimontia celer TaxID=1796497 RepID=A0A128F1E6_9GAMM|nr:hemolysin family protein [Grimontia celer]CZF80628.1 Magnesium and cobalt efflux protein CorC [Grimontia celer]